MNSFIKRSAGVYPRLPTIKFITSGSDLSSSLCPCYVHLLVTATSLPKHMHGHDTMYQPSHATPF